MRAVSQCVNSDASLPTPREEVFLWPTRAERPLDGPTESGGPAGTAALRITSRSAAGHGTAGVAASATSSPPRGTKSLSQYFGWSTSSESTKRNHPGFSSSGRALSLRERWRFKSVIPDLGKRPKTPPGRNAPRVHHPRD